ncbi:hypothetical protein NFI96_031124 [Prochilodus magdalenae]|nr:hypothetical protein NFI96_031124 [Prochilodus magdalenae]
MEAEDPISAKFQTLIESLMAKTTSEIVKVFAEVLLETRMEISHNWREIDELKQKLEVSEEQRAEAILRSETTVNSKGETEDLLESHEGPHIAVSDARTVCQVGSRSKAVEQIPKDAIVENSGIAQSSVVIHETTTSQTTPGEKSSLSSMVQNLPSAENPASIASASLPSAGTVMYEFVSNKESSSQTITKDCNHDVYNGVFPVEKILRWRNTKGRNEVRVKWMPCTLCGAKWKNTWEPAESFTSYKDTKNEDEK